MAEFGVQVVSLVWLWATPNEVQADKAFKALFAKEADNIVQNKVPNPVTGILSQATSVDSERGLSATVQPGRLEVSTSHPDEAAGVPSSWEAEVGFDALQDLVAHFAAHKSSLVERPSRLATHVRAFKAANSAEEASRMLIPYIGLKAPLDRPLDVAVTLNQRAPLPSMKGHSMNRLMNFSVGTVQEVVVPVPGPGPGQGQMVTTVERHYANLFVDVNSTPTGREFNFDEQVALFTDMAAEAIRLSRSSSIEALT